MKKEKRWIMAGILSAILTVAVLTGCGGYPPSPPTGEQIPHVVAAVFPIYDWTRQIMGDRAEAVNLTLLMDNGIDLHSFQPTVDDMVSIDTCDLLLYIGGVSDQWLRDALTKLPSARREALCLMETLGDAAKEEEIVEGMQEEDSVDPDGRIHGTPEAVELDEHIWLSLRNARTCCKAIARSLSRLDPDGAETYGKNLSAYLEALDQLDAQYQEAVEHGAVRTVVVGDRFPFRYLTEDYGLDYYAAFAGCSAETEASFETVVFLAGKLDALGLSHVVLTESGDARIARAIVENTAAKDAQILRLDSLQSVTTRQIADGVTYLDIMKANLAVLREALDA